MSLGLFKRIYDEIDGQVEKVFLWNYGEPLLNPNIGTMLDYIRFKRPATVLSTTGLPLASMSSVSGLGALDELIISMNGFDEETYNFHQKGGDFNTVIFGLERIKRIMAESQTKYVLQVVVNSRNETQIPTIDRFAKLHGFKQVVLKSFNVMDGSEETKASFLPKDGNLSRYSSKQPRIGSLPCLDWMVINWDGDVNLCCWDYEGSVIPGNVADQGVFGVWNSDVMKSLKQDIISGVKPEFCIDCTCRKSIKEWDVR